MEFDPRNPHGVLGEVADSLGLNTRAPTQLSKKLKDVCAQLAPDQSPVFLDTPGLESVEGTPGECFANVEQRIKKDGGSTQHGWTIWQAPWLFDCEFHAVWKRPDGQLENITPAYQEKDKCILFLPDPKTDYIGKQVPNRLFPRYKDKDIRHLIQICNESNRMRCGRIPENPQRRLELGQKLLDIDTKLRKRHRK